MRSTVALFALLGACDSSDTTINRVYPDLVVVPGTLDFGDVAVDYSGASLLQLLNAGVAPLEIESITVEGDDAASFTLDTPGPLTLTKDEGAAVGVAFAPDTYLPYAAELVIRSNDEEHPELVVPLTGVGVYAPTPDIAIDPLAVEFGEVPVGEDAFETLEIRNDGGSTLTILSAEQHGSGAFSLVGASPAGFAIPPGQSQQLVWQYSPYADIGDNGTFVVQSDDPDEPELTVFLLGNGGGDFEYPEAVIDCPTGVGPRELITLDGRGSSDPQGLELSYAWTIEELPSGSAVERLEDATEAEAWFTTDVAGVYAVGLVVTNSAGVPSAKRICQMDAIPVEDLHVELSWNTANADLDLHVLQGDAEFFDVPGDCNYCNQIPDWGLPLDTTDDPSLDIDDRAGFGPENINLDLPADGAYRVIAHYFDSHGDKTVLATVRVYAYGVLVHEESRSMEYNYTWEVGQVNWPDGTVGATGVYRFNYLYDADGNPILMEDGITKTPGPRSCSTG